MVKNFPSGHSFIWHHLTTACYVWILHWASLDCVWGLSLLVLQNVCNVWCTHCMQQTGHITQDITQNPGVCGLYVKQWLSLATLGNLRFPCVFGPSVPPASLPWGGRIISEETFPILNLRCAETQRGCTGGGIYNTIKFKMQRVLDYRCIFC